MDHQFDSIFVGLRTVSALWILTSEKTDENLENSLMLTPNDTMPTPTV